MEDAARARADAAGNDRLGLEHLIVDFLDDLDVLFVHATGDEEDISMLGIAGIDDAESLDVEARAQRREHLDVATVAARGIVVDDPG